MKSQIYLCPACNNRTVVNELKTVAAKEIREVWPGEKVEFQKWYTVCQCSTCESVLLFVTDEDNDEATDLNTNLLIFPKNQNLPYYLPEQLRSCYHEASRIKNSSPAAFAVLIRKCLEYLCIDQKADGKNLYTKLLYLVKSGIIPKNLTDISFMLQKIGNAGAHAGNISISWSDAQVIDSFFLTIIEYVYIAPYKLLEYRRRLNKLPKIIS